ncbi:MAG: hypothetical protein Q9170_002691 [Blastenia crenularia]
MQLPFPSLLIPLFLHHTRSNAAATTTPESLEPIDLDTLDSTPPDLNWTTINIPRAGQTTPVTYALACTSAIGAGLEARSCFGALAYAPRGTGMKTWVMQGQVPPGVQPDVELPRLVVSNDTSCMIQPTLAPFHTLAFASAFNVSEAARAVIIGCVIPRRIGGYAMNIGGDNRLRVGIKKSPLRAQCGSPIRATPQSCHYILDEMNKSAQRLIFGRPGSSGQLDVALPLTLRSRQFSRLRDYYVHAAISTFQQIWFTAEVVIAACVRGGKGGQGIVAAMTTIGRFASLDLKVTIMDETAELQLPGLSSGMEEIGSSTETA